MNVSLTPELESFVQRKVASGLYTSASEVIREGLRLLEEQERLKEAHRNQALEKVEEGWAAAQRGELLDGPAVMKELRTLIGRRARPPRKNKKRG